MKGNRGSEVWVWYWGAESQVLVICVLVRMGDETLQYFLRKGKIENEDAADVGWFHAANSRSGIAEGLQSKHLVLRLSQRQFPDIGKFFFFTGYYNTF